ncbi:MAG: hypothetical protein WC523_05375 [Patescibacteria group bacterium]|jgi:hypothetical protein
MKNKKIIIISALILLAIIVFLLIIFLNKEMKSKTVDREKTTSSTPFKVEFLSNQEKTQLGIPTDLKIQSLKRGPKNELVAYKIIKNDADIITDLSQIGPISPREQKKLQ